MKKTTVCRLLSLLMTGVLLFTGCGASEGTSSTPDASTTGTSTPDTSNTDTSLPEGEIALTSREFTVTPQTVRFFGRYHLDIQKAIYGFSNVAAGVTFAFTGSSLELELTCSEYTEHWINYVMVYIDDRDPVPVRIEKDAWYTVATDLDPAAKHTVRVVKSSMSNAGAVYMKKVRLAEGAKLYSVPITTTHKIQVIGDSITCGYGTRWDGSDTEEVTMYQGGDDCYTTMLAEKLDAELEVVAISGGGVGNIENAPYPILPSYKKEDMKSASECDFTKYVPEVVVIALGTNDVGQNNPPDVFKTNAARMVKFIREQYPDATIVWTYGVMGAPAYANHIEEMVADLKEDGDNNVYFLPIDPPTADEAPYGQHGHPGYKTHQRMANELATFIAGITGWTVNQ